MRYPLTFYVQSLPPDVGGCANAFVIRILEKYKNDEGIYQHELTHVKQWVAFFAVGLAVAMAHYAVHSNWFVAASIALIGASVHGIYYRFVEPYRLHCEVESYRVQSEHYQDDRRKLFAVFIAKNYNLNITPEEAGQLLRR